MDDTARLRYSRHLLLPEWSEELQARVARARVLIIGLGGLGCAVAPYLASSGIGHLLLADFDTVSLDNLQRQTLYKESDVGRFKAEAAAEALQALNSSPDYQVITDREAIIRNPAMLDTIDGIVDCTDNFSSRYTINQLCQSKKIPLISGAAVEWEGLCVSFDFKNASSPCYHCLFPEGEEVMERRCATTGIFAPLVGLIGTLQATETLKLLTGLPRPWENQLLSINLATGKWRQSRFVPDPECPVCATPQAR